jgi:hypothetical protein
MWHSRWSSARVFPPQFITLDLGIPRAVSRLVYLPRQDANLNGTITQYQVHGSNSGSNWTLIGAGTWADTHAVKEATLTNTASMRRYFKLISDLDWAGLRDFRAAEIELRNLAGLRIAPANYAVFASSTASGSTVARLSDGSNATAWRSADNPALPVELVFSFNAATNVGSFRYVPESDGSATGDVRLFRFYSSENGNGWDLVRNGELAGPVDASSTVMTGGAGASSTNRPSIQNEFVALRALALAQENFAASFDEAPFLPGYDRWALVAMTFESSGARAPAANPDGDRHVNLLEWLFGGDPLAQEEALPGEPRCSGLTNGFMQWDGRLAPHVDSFFGSLAVSAELTNWFDAGTNAVWQVEGPPDDLGMRSLQLQYRVSAPGPEFLRPYFRTGP